MAAKCRLSGRKASVALGNNWTVFTEALEEEISWECQPAQKIPPLNC